MGVAGLIPQLPLGHQVLVWSMMEMTARGEQVIVLLSAWGAHRDSMVGTAAKRSLVPDNRPTQETSQCSSFCVEAGGSIPCPHGFLKGPWVPPSPQNRSHSSLAQNQSGLTTGGVPLWGGTAPNWLGWVKGILCPPHRESFNYVFIMFFPFFFIKQYRMKLLVVG